MTPVITVEENMETGEFTLMATSYSTTEPAGPRLFRGGDLPDIQFAHFDADNAEHDRALLQRYCDLAWAGKAPKAKGREEKEAEAAAPVDLSGAWWK